MKPKALIMPYRIQGLQVFCNSCKANVSNKICKKKKCHIRACPHPNRQVFKASFAQPKTNGTVRKTRSFKTRDFKDAVRLCLEFEQELVQNQFHTQNPARRRKKQQKSRLLVHAMASYMAFMNNEGVPDHKKRERTAKYLKDVERNLRIVVEMLLHNGIDHKCMTIDALNDDIVGQLHSYLIDIKHYKNRSYNGVMATMRSLFIWMNEEGYLTSNPFKGVSKRKTSKTQLTITESEFEELLTCITPEKGIKVLNTGEKKYYYDEHLKGVLNLAIHTGLRREELYMVKWSDLVFDENQAPQYFAIENFKVNKLMNASDEEKKFKVVAVTNAVKRVLVEHFDYDNRQQNQYVVAPNDKRMRKTLWERVSKSFSHYWSFVDSSKNLKFNDLRNTFISNLVLFAGDKAPLLTSHASLELIQRHYLDKTLLTKTVQNFEVFSEKKPDS